MGGGGRKTMAAWAATGGGAANGLANGVAGGLPVPFTAHAFSVFVFFKGASGGGTMLSGTRGAEHLAFLFTLGLGAGEGRSGFAGTGVMTGLALAQLLGDAVVETVSALSGETDLRYRKYQTCKMSRLL